MATAAVTEFPAEITSGDAVRVTIADSRYPASAWALKVWLQGQDNNTVQGFDAPAGANEAYDLYITPAQSAAIHSGHYLVAYVFTEDTPGTDRVTKECSFTVQVYANPAVAEAKSSNRLILEAMEAAYLAMSTGGMTQSVNLNGQSYTNQNLPEFWRAIEYQRAIVAAEDADRLGHRKIRRILHPI